MTDFRVEENVCYCLLASIVRYKNTIVKDAR